MNIRNHTPFCWLLINLKHKNPYSNPLATALFYQSKNNILMYSVKYPYTATSSELSLPSGLLPSTYSASREPTESYFRPTIDYLSKNSFNNVSSSSSSTYNNSSSTNRLSHKTSLSDLFTPESLLTPPVLSHHNSAGLPSSLSNQTNFELSKAYNDNNTSSTFAFSNPATSATQASKDTSCSYNISNTYSSRTSSANGSGLAQNSGNVPQTYRYSIQNLTSRPTNITISNSISIGTLIPGDKLQSEIASPKSIDNTLNKEYNSGSAQKVPTMSHHPVHIHDELIPNSNYKDFSKPPLPGLRSTQNSSSKTSSKKESPVMLAQEPKGQYDIFKRIMTLSLARKWSPENLNKVWTDLMILINKQGKDNPQVIQFVQRLEEKRTKNRSKSSHNIGQSSNEKEKNQNENNMQQQNQIQTKQNLPMVTIHQNRPSLQRHFSYNGPSTQPWNHAYPVAHHNPERFNPVKKARIVKTKAKSAERSVREKRSDKPSLKKERVRMEKIAQEVVKFLEKGEERLLKF